MRNPWEDQERFVMTTETPNKLWNGILWGAVLMCALMALTALIRLWV